MIYGNTVGGSGGGGIGKTFILQDEDGNELVGVVVDQNVIFDATANDIRAGKVAATMEGVTTGEKDIPAYNTSEGYKLIPVGSAVKITGAKDYEYTKLQVLICAFNTQASDSVATEKVSIDGKVYAVNSTDVISSVTVESENKAINLGITNNGEKPLIIRYFMYKEIY